MNKYQSITTSCAVLTISTIFIYLNVLFINNNCCTDILLLAITCAERIVHITIYLIFFTIIFNYKNHRIIYNKLFRNFTIKMKILCTFDLITSTIASSLFHTILCNTSSMIICISFVIINTLMQIPSYVFKEYFTVTLWIIKCNFVDITKQIKTFDGKLITIKRLLNKYQEQCQLTRYLYDNSKLQMFCFVALIFFELCYGVFNIIDSYLIGKSSIYKIIMVYWCLNLLIKSYFMFYMFDDVKLEVCKNVI